LIPGTFSDASQWFEVVDRFPEKLPVVLIELRGHGGSWPPKTDTTVEELAQDTLWFLSQIGVEKFHAGGHSLGGMLSLELGRVAPDRVVSVLSVEGWTNREAAKEAFGDRMYSTLSPEQMEDRTRRRASVEEKWTQQTMDDFAKIWGLWTRGREFLETTDLPVFEVYGDRGGSTEGLAERLQIPRRPNIRIEWIPDASHDLPREKPTELGDLMAAFLSSLQE
jgi:pimeloyl-ACP methyl ester carboxylesterase